MRLLRFNDFDHDGRATEFLVQVATFPCGKHEMVAVGITKDRPRIHVLENAEAPGKAFSMPEWVWNRLAESPAPLTQVVWPCGDHGAEVETELTVRAEAGAIHATGRSYSCATREDPDGWKRRLLDVYPLTLGYREPAPEAP